MISRTGTQCHPIRPAVFPVMFNVPVHCRTHLVTGINTEIRRSENLDCGCLCCDTVHIGRSPIFGRYLLSPSLMQKCWECSRPTFCCNVRNHLLDYTVSHLSSAQSKFILKKLTITFHANTFFHINQVLISLSVSGIK